MQPILNLGVGVFYAGLYQNPQILRKMSVRIMSNSTDSLYVKFVIRHRDRTS
jgi:hypothetical protein